MVYPSLAECRELAKVGNLIPLSEEVHFDWETPLSAFRKIEDGKFSFLLESVEGGEKWGRYSFLGSGPSHLFRSKGEEYEIWKKGEVWERGKTKDPLRALEAFLGQYRPALPDSLPRFFGGAVGYAGYDAVRYWERMPEILEQKLPIDDSYFMIVDTLLVFDNVRQKIKVIANMVLDGSQPLEEAYRTAEEKIRSVKARLQSPAVLPPKKKPAVPGALHANMSPEEFRNKVGKAKEYIRAGDVIQIVLSQRFSTSLHCEPFDVYRALRSINPSPYLFYLHLDDIVLLGASPEVMVRLEGRQIELRPLAGTRRRGKTPAEDRRMEEDLLADEKERAEHIMLVDLGRNDLGRVSQYGTVRVEELMTIERYSHVMHLVSSLRGHLRDGVDRWDSLMACFPAGTVSGAPKVRAMEIIDELEPTKRGVYAGAVMYVDFSNNLDSCIAIRTLVVRGNKGYIQAGGGIVADSVPENEYMETINKSRALIRAINLAQRGFEL
jgi:anthranilate synthase component 1